MKGNKPESKAQTYLVINPGSRGGRGQAIAATYLRLLTDNGARHDWGLTRDLDDATQLTRQALARGYTTIVAVGGDGTINRVINGFCSARRKPPGARMGVLYAGTSPDFCHFHSIPTDPARAVALLLDGAVHPIDVCRLRHCDRDGETRTDYFASSTNIGLGAGIAARANRYRPFLGDFLGTLLASVVTIAGQRPLALRLILDGEEVTLASCLNITVGKNPHLASGLKLDLSSSPSDGRFFVFGLDRISRWGLLRTLPQLYSGAVARRQRFFLQRGRSLRIEPLQHRVPTEFDGDPAGWCPAEVTLLPGTLALIGGRLTGGGQ